ncbi:MAG: hypothetical protein JST26_03290 [Bacteroidetes bacterium]|nr:hypothetical protein [Bacteroidota bacterium]
MKTLFSFLGILILFSSCSKYGYVTVHYPIRPMMHFPDSIQRMALADRSLTRKENMKGSVIEAIITGEIGGSDKRASLESMRAVYDRFNNWRGVQVLNSNGLKLYGTGTGEVPDPLPWQQVRYLCDSLHSDVLLVLEMFDSNSNLLQSAVASEVVQIATTGNSNPPPVQVRMTVNSYWRLYDPYHEQILDEFRSSNYMNFNVSSPLSPPPPEALQQTAYQAGIEYIQRFLPTYYNVRRDMYKRGKGRDKLAFKRAFRKAEVADWNAAAEDWTKLAKSHKRRNAGRACLNLAVAYEVLGQTSKALEWARKAYEEYNNKIARNYVDNLRFRLRYE